MPTILLIIVTFFTCYSQPLVSNDGLAVRVGAGLTMTLEGAFTNQTNVSLGTVDNAGTITLTGDWTNNSANTVFSTGNGIVQFLGGTARSITGSNSTGFYDLTINNTSATGVTLAKPITVANILTLTDGFLYTGAVNILTMNAGSSVGGVSDVGFVSGPMAKAGSTDFTFPVGKDVKYRPIRITSLSAVETFTAEYVHVDPNTVPYDVSLKDASLNHIGRCEYWTLNRAAGINAWVTLSWDSYSCGMDNLTDIRVAGWDGTLWKDRGNGGTTGAIDPGTGTVISSAIVTEFGPFSLASSSINNPLPVELLSFTAILKNNSVDLKWATATEINNDFFTIERSADGAVFESLLIVKGAGNSSTILNYNAVDNEPMNGVSYYRLKQTDYNGKTSYSRIVDINNADNVSSLSIFPNPSNGIFEIAGSKTQISKLEIFNVLGKKIYEAAINNNSSIINLDVPAGTYLMQVQAEQEMISKKIIIQ